MLLPSSPLTLLAPYEFSPMVLIACAAAVFFHALGRHRLRGAKTGPAGWQSTLFILGVALIYIALQTRVDYWSQHMFFVHRLQHLVLHHLGPFLVALAAPATALRTGLPRWLQRRTARCPPILMAPLKQLWALLKQPLVAALLFAGLVVFWLVSTVHFYAMLNVPLYDLMNWSMAVDGLIFWFLVLDRRSPARSPALGYGWRLTMLALVMPPQIAAGAYIALCRHDLYPVYAVCGRLWPINPVTDQILGGLITWIPAAMMSVAGMLFVLRQLLHDSAAARADTPPPSRRSPRTLPHANA